VILLDANLLIYAHVKSFPRHNEARIWLDEQLNGFAPVGIPWASVTAFLRLVTNPRIFEHPETMAQAWQQVREWLSAHTVRIPQPGERHSEILGKLLSLPGVDSNLVPDAHLAAIALEHGLILCTTDGDFARFPGLSWRYPLAK
jgi:toxin-antitoxin system PIN domain toxin